MKRVLIASLFICSTLIMADEQALTNANSPTFNSAPTMQQASSNFNVQQNNSQFTQIGEVRCPNATISAAGYGGITDAENSFNRYETTSDTIGLQAGINIPIGDTVASCKEAQDIKLSAMKFDSISKLVRMCMDMIQAGVIISDQLKGTEEYEDFKICDHFRIMSKDNPTNYAKAQQQVILATKKPKVSKVLPKTLRGFREYRIRFEDVRTCASSCQGSVGLKVKQIKAVKLEKEKVYLVPFGNKGNISLYVRGNYLTQNSAEVQLMKYYEAGIPAKVVGVLGTEIYK
jgi:hypothetical protein